MTPVSPASKVRRDQRESLAHSVRKVPLALLVKKERGVLEENPELLDRSDLLESGYVTQLILEVAFRHWLHKDKELKHLEGSLFESDDVTPMPYFSCVFAGSSW